jgi:preprotein translocase subunit SecE
MTFEIYKKGQGSAARIATAAALAAIALFGCAELKAVLPPKAFLVGSMRVEWRMLTAALVFVGCVAGIAWLTMVWAKLVDYLILTEAELRKVVWPSRRDLIQQTIVVIFTSVLLGIIIVLVDICFSRVFTYIKVL